MWPSFCRLQAFRLRRDACQVHGRKFLNAEAAFQALKFEKNSTKPGSLSSPQDQGCCFPTTHIVETRLTNVAFVQCLPVFLVSFVAENPTPRMADGSDLETQVRAPVRDEHWG